MNIEPQKLVIDLKKRDSQSAYGIQGDVGTRQVDIYIMQGNSIFDLSGLQVLLYCITPDKSKIYIDVTITNATTGKLTVDIPQQILGLNGTTTCCLIFRQGEKQLLSYDFYIKVADSIYDEGYIQASDDFSALLKALDQVEKYDKELQDASTNLENKYTTRLTAAEKDLLFKATKEELKNVNTKVDNNTVQLDNKANQVDVLNKADKNEVRKNTIPLTLNDCDNTMINAIQGGGSTSFNLLSIPRAKSVDYSKTDFIKVVSNNLVDMSKVKVGQTISGSTGGDYPNASTNLLGYFPVEPNTKYTLKYVANYGFYKADQSFISNAPNSALDTPFTITTPAECYYVRLVYYPAKPLVQMNLGETLLPYDIYKLKLGDTIDQLTISQKDDINKIPFINDRVDGILGSVVTNPVLESELNIVNGTFTLNKGVFTLQRGSNQYAWLYRNNSSAKARYKVKSGDVNLVLVANNNECVFLTYSGANAGRVQKATTSTAPQLLAKFDDVTPYTVTDGDELYITYENYKVVIQIKKVGTTTFVPYMTRDLISVKTQIDTVGRRELGFATLVTGAIYNLEYGFSETIEERTDILYKKYLDGELGSGGGGTTPSTNDDFINDIWTAMGDSITAWDSTQSPVFGTNYRDLVREKLNIGTVNNRGIGSTQIARKEGYEFDNLSFVNRWKNNTPTNSTIITVWGGTNDYFGAGNDGVPLGDSAITNKDVYTFYGALRVLIDGMATSFPDRKIGFFTPMFRVNCTQPNQQGHTLKDYANAIIQVCEEYGIPVLDLYRISGINANNHVTLLADGLHPKGLGHQFISRKIAKFIDRL